MFIVLFILMVIICIVVAISAKEIAIMKGHTDKKYFWYTLLFTPYGLALVIALPDLYARPTAVAPVVHNETLPEL